jgi:hypothetical protein
MCSYQRIESGFNTAIPTKEQRTTCNVPDN